MTTSRDPEHEARAALARGETGLAITILRKAYGISILRYCQRFLRDEELAQDIQQVVFIQAFLSLTCFSGRAPFSVWLHSIARYRCLDARKASRAWSGHFSVEPEVPDAVDPAPSAEQQLVASAEVELLEMGLQMLPEKDRSAIRAHHLEQLSYDEMARQTGERAGTLRVRVSRALLVLSRHLCELEARMKDDRPRVRQPKRRKHRG